jgi:Spy/CpxP family protein refolding chaperone
LIPLPSRIISLIQQQPPQGISSALYFFSENAPMKRVKTVIGVVTLALLFSGVLAGQDKKLTDKKPTDKKPAKGKGRMPAYYGKLNLKDDQKKQILAIQEEYGPKIRQAKQAWDNLKEQRTQALEKVLTAEQKTKLRELAAARKKGKKSTASKDTKKKPRKKKEKKGSKTKDKKSDAKKKTNDK